jgi:hypothetical protein
MHPIKRLSSGLGLATLTFLTQISLAAAHAGEHHPPPASDVPWPIAGPIIALLISGAAFWLTNRDGSPRPLSPATSPSDPNGTTPDQINTRAEVSSGLPAHHDPRKRAPLVALRSQQRPSPRAAVHRTEEPWIMHDLTR